MEFSQSELLYLARFFYYSLMLFYSAPTPYQSQSTLSEKVESFTGRGVHPSPHQRLHIQRQASPLFSDVERETN